MGNLSKKQIVIIIIIGVLFFIVVGGYLYNVYSGGNDENFIEEVEEDYQQNSVKSENIVVHIAGEVNNPGIIRANNGSRVADIVEEAGGFTSDADISNVNLAYLVQDGQKITIPSIQDSEEENEDNKTLSSIISDDGGGIIENTKEEDNLSESININKATQTELEQLPGIGPSTALKIIEYRKTNGKFKSIEDIKNVSGIGEAKYEKIKDYITV